MYHNNESIIWIILTSNVFLEKVSCMLDSPWGFIEKYIESNEKFYTSFTKGISPDEIAPHLRVSLLVRQRNIKMPPLWYLISPCPDRSEWNRNGPAEWILPLSSKISLLSHKGCSWRRWSYRGLTKVTFRVGKKVLHLPTNVEPDIREHRKKCNIFLLWWRYNKNIKRKWQQIKRYQKLCELG